MATLQILSNNPLKTFEKNVRASVNNCFQELTESDFTIQDFKYYDNRQAYYNGLNVGVIYYETLERLGKILPFLTLLPQAVCYKPID